MTIPAPPFLEDVRAQGFSFVGGATMRSWLESEGSLDDWDRFAESWNRLEPDTYLARLGKQRRRRYAVFSLDAVASDEWTVHREPHQPHFQSLAYNALQGDIERWFAPIETAAGESDSLQAILRHCAAMFGRLAPRVGRWHAEVHQFRIEAQADAPGTPTPEGMHRDGVDYVLVLLIDRDNVASGTTTIHDIDGAEVGMFTLARAFDAALVDDARVFHGVTPVEAIDPARPSHRDVLVVTLRGQAGPGATATQPR